jgi:hypothetical protein
VLAEHPRWVEDSTLVVVNFLSGAPLEQAISIMADPNYKQAIREWIFKEAEIAETSPPLAKLLRRKSLDMLNWEVIFTYLQVKADVQSKKQIH